MILIGPDVNCPYCKVRIRMYGSQFANVSDGEFHTCNFDMSTYKGPMYFEGDFVHLGLPIMSTDKL